MSAYQVRALSGTYLPANGFSTLVDATPSPWTSLGDGHQAGIIYAWSGGGKGTGTKLYIQGGGHVDGDNNGLYLYDFAGSSKPNGWSIVSQSLTSAVQNGDTYSDGRPSACHMYDGLVTTSNGAYVYRLMGVPRSAGGGFSPACFKFNTGASTWSQITDYPTTPAGAAAMTIYNPAAGSAGKIWVNEGDSWRGAFLDLSDDSWSANRDSGDDSGESCGAYDTSRGNGLILNSSETPSFTHNLLTFDWNAETVSSITNLTITGDTAILGTKCSTVYDPTRDSFWFFGGPTGGVGWDNLYEMPANGPPWVITAHALTGDAIVETTSPYTQRGSYGRFVFRNSERFIGVVASHISPAYVIKLP